MTLPGKKNGGDGVIEELVGEYESDRDECVLVKIKEKGTNERQEMAGQRE